MLNNYAHPIPTDTKFKLWDSLPKVGARSKLYTALKSGPKTRSDLIECMHPGTSVTSPERLYQYKLTFQRAMYHLRKLGIDITFYPGTRLYHLGLPSIEGDYSVELNKLVKFLKVEPRTCLEIAIFHRGDTPQTVDDIYKYRDHVGAVVSRIRKHGIDLKYDRHTKLYYFEGQMEASKSSQERFLINLTSTPRTAKYLAERVDLKASTITKIILKLKASGHDITVDKINRSNYYSIKGETCL